MEYKAGNWQVIFCKSDTVWMFPHLLSPWEPKKSYQQDMPT